MKATWYLDIFRSLFFLIDKIVYKFIVTVYNLFIEISETTIFSNDMIEDFLGKVYALLGIFMLFKVSFSILTYIVNPDEFTDKNKGMSKLVTNIITSLILLVGTPFLFSQAMELQKIIIEDNVIPKLLTTNEINMQSKICSTKDRKSGACNYSAGEEMSSTTFKAFFECGEDCPKDDLDSIFDLDVNTEDGNKHYSYNYQFIISTAVGVVLILILISFCLDVAVRSVKLGFLRLIAPVPIIGRVDPKKGSELFNKWTQNCVSTYLDLFLRLIAIYFAIYIISSVASGGFYDVATGEQIDNVSLFVKVFIILGTLMFAKQLPKLIEEILGINLSGSFSLNPLKKLENEALGGKALRRLPAAAGGAVLGAGITAVAGVRAHRDLGHGGWKQTAGALGGFVAGAFRGGRAAYGSGGKDTFKKTLDASKIGAQKVYAKDGTSLGGRIVAGIQQKVGLDTEADKYDKQVKEYESIAGSIDSMMKHANSEMIKYDHLGFNDSNGAAITMEDFKNEKERLNALRNVDTSHWGTIRQQQHYQQINALQSYISQTEKKAEQAYIDQVRAGTLLDNSGNVLQDIEITATYDNIVDKIGKSTDSVVRTISVHNASDMKKAKDTLNNEKISVTMNGTNSVTNQEYDYDRAQANKKYYGNK